MFFKEVQKRTSLGPGEIWTLVCSLHTTLLYHSSHHLHRHCHWHSETSLEYQTRENKKMNLNQIWKQIFPSFHFFLFWSARKIFFYFFEIFRDSSERHWQREELKDFGFWAWTCKPIQKLFRRSLSLSNSHTHMHTHTHTHTRTYTCTNTHSLSLSISPAVTVNLTIVSLSLSFTSEVGDKFYQWQKLTKSSGCLKLHLRHFRFRTQHLK